MLTNDSHAPVPRNRQDGDGCMQVGPVLYASVEHLRETFTAYHRPHLRSSCDRQNRIKSIMPLPLIDTLVDFSTVQPAAEAFHVVAVSCWGASGARSVEYDAKLVRHRENTV